VFQKYQFVDENTFVKKSKDAHEYPGWNGQLSHGNFCDAVKVGRKNFKVVENCQCRYSRLIGISAICLFLITFIDMLM